MLGMDSTARLALLMFAGAGLGYAAAARLFVQMSDAAGYGFAEGQRWRFIAVVLGAVLGLIVEYVFRLRRRGWKFTIREMFVAMTIVAAAAVVIGALATWGASPL